MDSSCYDEDCICKDLKKDLNLSVAPIRPSVPPPSAKQVLSESLLDHFEVLCKQRRDQLEEAVLAMSTTKTPGACVVELKKAVYDNGHYKSMSQALECSGVKKGELGGYTSLVWDKNDTQIKDKIRSSFEAHVANCRLQLYGIAAAIEKSTTAGACLVLLTDPILCIVDKALEDLKILDSGFSHSRGYRVFLLPEAEPNNQKK